MWFIVKSTVVASPPCTARFRHGIVLYRMSDTSVCVGDDDRDGLEKKEKQAVQAPCVCTVCAERVETCVTNKGLVRKTLNWEDDDGAVAGEEVVFTKVFTKISKIHQNGE